jgi:hypothetical protein
VLVVTSRVYQDASTLVATPAYCKVKSLAALVGVHLVVLESVEAINGLDEFMISFFATLIRPKVLHVLLYDEWFLKACKKGDVLSATSLIEYANTYTKEKVVNTMLRDAWNWDLVLLCSLASRRPILNLDTLLDLSVSVFEYLNILLRARETIQLNGATFKCKLHYIPKETCKKIYASNYDRLKQSLSQSKIR